MASTFTQLYTHFVFSTKGLKPWLPAGFLPNLHAYVAQIVKAEFGFIRAVGGTADHIHILADLKSTACPAICMRDVKSHSSKWAKAELANPAFAWQEGYGAFSVSASKVATVVRYIEDQQRHHQYRSFKDEFLLMLDKHGVKYDIRYVWD